MKIVKVKSIPNVDNDRLVDSLSQICLRFHSPRLRDFDGPRREMYNHCVKIRPIVRELISRGQPNPRANCRICTARYNKELQ